MLRGAYYRTVGILARIAGSAGAEHLAGFLSLVRRAEGFSGGSASKKEYLHHLERIFPEKSLSWRNRIIHKYWLTHQRAMLGLFACNRYSRTEMLNRTVWQNRECLDSAFSRGKGVVLLAPHFGDDRTMHILLAMAGYPMHVISSDYSNASEAIRNARLRASRKWHHVAFPKDNPRWIYEALEKAEIVQIAPTAYGGPRGYWVKSFGVPVLMSSSPFRLMRRTGCSLVLGMNHALKGLRYRLDFRAFAPAGNGEQAAQELFREIDDIGRFWPEQYNWMNLSIRHRESNTIARLGKIPDDERILEELAVPEDGEPRNIHSLNEIKAFLTESSSRPDQES